MGTPPKLTDWLYVTLKNQWPVHYWNSSAWVLCSSFVFDCVFFFVCLFLLNEFPLHLFLLSLKTSAHLTYPTLLILALKRSRVCGKHMANGGSHVMVLILFRGPPLPFCVVSLL